MSEETNTEAWIRFEDVHKAFGKQHIYRGLNLEIPRGQTTVVIGESGTGKSVLLKMLIGLIRPDSGHIYFDGVDITTLDEQSFGPIRRRIAMLFQGSALFDSLSVYENVAYSLREHRDLPEQEIKRVVQEKLELVGLEADVAKKVPSQLSGGMKKRVALARALASEPEVLLYDEPTTGLDPPNTRRISELISTLKNKLDMTSIVVTHDMASAFLVGDRMSLISDGRADLTADAASFRESNAPEIREFIGAMEQAS